MLDLTGLLKCLVANQVRFVLVGGFAASVHGSPMVTNDVDICLDLSPLNISLLWQVLNHANPRLRMHPEKPKWLKPADGDPPIKNLYLLTDYGQLDCLGFVLGVGDYNDAIKKSIEVKLFGSSFHTLDINALIAAKTATNREKDRLAVILLKAIAERNSPPNDDV